MYCWMYMAPVAGQQPVPQSTEPPRRGKRSPALSPSASTEKPTALDLALQQPFLLAAKQMDKREAGLFHHHYLCAAAIFGLPQLTSNGSDSNTLQSQAREKKQSCWLLLGALLTWAFPHLSLGCCHFIRFSSYPKCLLPPFPFLFYTWLMHFRLKVWGTGINILLIRVYKVQGKN